MKMFKIDSEELANSSERIMKIINILNKEIRGKKELDFSDITTHIFIKKVYPKNVEVDEEYFENLYTMNYQERLETDLKKIRYKVQIDCGRSKLEYRIPTSDGLLPQIIEFYSESLKLIMITEQETIGDEDVINSIPPLNQDIFNKYGYHINNIINIDVEEDEIYEPQEEIDNDVYDINDILDKLGENIELTEGEKKFLNNYNK